MPFDAGDRAEQGTLEADFVSTWIHVPPRALVTSFHIVLANADAEGVVRIFGANDRDHPIELAFKQADDTLLPSGFTVALATDVNEPFEVPRSLRYLRYEFDRTAGTVASTIKATIEHSFAS